MVLDLWFHSDHAKLVLFWIRQNYIHYQELWVQSDIKQTPEVGQKVKNSDTV